jgi:hypothetical protein
MSNKQRIIDLLLDLRNRVKERGVLPPFAYATKEGKRCIAGHIIEILDGRIPDYCYLESKAKFRKEDNLFIHAMNFTVLHRQFSDFKVIDRLRLNPKEVDALRLAVPNKVRNEDRVEEAIKHIDILLESYSGAEKSLK